MDKNQNNFSEGGNNSEIRLVNNNGIEKKKVVRKASVEAMGNLFLQNMMRPPVFVPKAQKSPVNNSTSGAHDLEHACLNRPVIPKEKRRRPSQLRSSDMNDLVIENNQ